MDVPDFEPQEGGVKIVFDVPEEDVEQTTRIVSGAGFEVRRYYPWGDGPRRGGAAPGYVRLGAELPMQQFTEDEQARIVARFDAVHAATGFACIRMGVDVWTAGGTDDESGVREPRRPAPETDSGEASLPGEPRA